MPTPDSGAFFRKSKDLKRSTRSKRQTRSNADNLQDQDDEGITQSPTLPRASDNFVDLGSDEEDEDDEMPITPGRNRTRKGARMDRVSEDDDELPRSSMGIRRGRKRASTMDDGEDDDEDELPKSSVRRRSMRNGQRSHQSTDDSEGEGIEVPSESEDERPRRSKHVLSLEERQELDDDLNDLKSSSSEDERPVRKLGAKEEHKLALERLKQRRAGVKQTEVINLDSDQEDEIPSDNDDNDLLGSPQPLPRSSARDMFNEDEYDDEFLADDGDDTLGAPADLPLVFTRYASMKPKELFQFAIEWMVQKKLNPGFNGTDEIYDLTFKKLDDEVKGLAGSKFESAAWEAEFLFALRARPQIAAGLMDRHDPDMAYKDKCDACNRSGHMPTYEVQFQGRPYHVETLEEVEKDEDASDIDEDDEDQSEESETRDARGNIILPESHSFYVGKFCYANAETAHALQHWRHHLYEWVVEWLQAEGYLSPEKIVKRDRWGEPKRRKYANKVSDKMAESGKVAELYRDFKDEINRARNAKQAHWNRSSP